ncbi:MAG: hypothetical protein HC804_06840, partial [Anaerolineae bacterium]|nr:hypothetical protein [Anaerolineae bacterium]
RTSSTWWYFILFPKDEEGYGPRQLMFSMATRVGEQIRISDQELPGLNLQRRIVDGVDNFPAAAVGWYYDGRTMHEDVLKMTAVTRLSLPDRTVACWDEGGHGQRQGYEICASDSRPLALEANIVGGNGRAHFTAWGDLNCLDNAPHESINIDTPIAGTHFVAWRRMHFQGEFELPGTGRETLKGYGYFQRVCLNVPAFPWKWIWALFPDGSMFSAYVPYLGLNLFRRGYQFFNSNRKEQATISIAPKSFWDSPDGSERIWLAQHTRVTPIMGLGEHPHFAVSSRNKEGDFMNFTAVPYARTGFFLERPLRNGRRHSHWNYNEYLFRMENLEGQIQGRPINKATMGQGFGNLEYTWGLGL